MKFSIVYLVLCEGDVVYASTDEEIARAYADNPMYHARKLVLAEWGNDDPTEKDIAEADFQAGYDGDNCEVIEVDISNKTKDDTLELPNGDEVDVSDIFEKLRRCE